MDTIFAVKGDGFVMMAADCSSARSILVFSTTEDKIMPLDEHKLLAQSGPQCDTANFAEYIQKNMALYELNNELSLTTHATANFMRRQLADAMRKAPYQTNILLGGYDKGAGSSLYFMDAYSALTKVNFGVHGHASAFTLSIFDREWKEGMSVEECKAVIEKCIAELQTRFLISQPNFLIKIVDANGTRIL